MILVHNIGRWPASFHVLAKLAFPHWAWLCKPHVPPLLCNRLAIDFPLAPCRSSNWEHHISACISMLSCNFFIQDDDGYVHRHSQQHSFSNLHIDTHSVALHQLYRHYGANSHTFSHQNKYCNIFKVC